MTRREVFVWAREQFDARGILTAVLDAEVLLCHVLGISRESLASDLNRKLRPTQLNSFRRLAGQRSRLVPIAYLTHTQAFYGLDFYVDRAVLIPRPESELLIDAVLEERGKGKGSRGKYTLADIGTGSGCLAVTLKKYLPNAKMLAVDSSARALTIARRNAKTHRARIQFFQGDLLQPLANQRLDVVVANLPYGRTSERPATATQSIWYEPKTAFVAGTSGLEVIEKCMRQLRRRAQKPSHVLLEFGWKQKNQLRTLAKNILPDYTPEFKKDLAGIDRLLILRQTRAQPTPRRA